MPGPDLVLGDAGGSLEGVVGEEDAQIPVEDQRGILHLEADFQRGEALGQTLQLDARDAANIRIVQRMESREPMRVDAGWRRWFSGATAPETARARANGEQ